MRYRVAFIKPSDSYGEGSTLDPSVQLDALLPEDVIAEKTFVERLEPTAQHSQETLDEDDAFLGSASPEVWEYEIVDARKSEFEDAMQRAGQILEFEVVDSTSTDAEDTTDDAIAQAEAVEQDDQNAAFRSPDAARDVTESGSGVRSGDDGPSGQPTGDPSAGGLSVGSGTAAREFPGGSSGEIDELTVVAAGDARLGLTNKSDDEASNTGATRNPDRGLKTENQRDYGSTLSPKKRAG